jgi:hypothetical protein
MRLADDAISLAQVNRLISRLRRIGLKAAGGNVVDLMEATRGGTVACGGSIKMDAADRIKPR